MNTIAFPPIEKGIPAPAPLKARKMFRGRPAAPWRVFLAGLVVGDSFRVLETSVQCIRRHAEALGIEVRTMKLDEVAEHDTPVHRVWRC